LPGPVDFDRGDRLELLEVDRPVAGRERAIAARRRAERGEADVLEAELDERTEASWAVGERGENGGSRRDSRAPRIAQQRRDPCRDGVEAATAAEERARSLLVLDAAAAVDAHGDGERSPAHERDVLRGPERRIRRDGESDANPELRSAPLCVMDDVVDQRP